MNKILAVAGLAVLLTGCGTFGHNSGKSAEFGFNLPNGNLTVEINSDGEFVSAKSTASAQVLSPTLAGKEAAVVVASARAKRNLAEYMSNGIRSENTVKQVADATNTDNTYAQNVVENISAESDQLLRGAYLSKQSLDGNTLTAEVTITRVSINGASSLRDQIAGVK